MTGSHHDTLASMEVIPACTVAAGGIAKGSRDALLFPYIVGCHLELFSGREMGENEENLMIGLSLASLPVSIALFPITLPVFAAAQAEDIIKYRIYMG